MIRVYGHPQTRSMRVTWALEEAGADYEYELVRLQQGEGRRPPYIELNPGGKVPALRHDGLLLTESAAICAWVGNQFPESGLLPEPRTADRAKCDQWCCFVIAELEQPLWTIAKHRFALPKKYRVPEIIETATWEFKVAAEVLAKGLGQRENLVGDRFTVADLLVSQTLAWARRFEMALPAANLEAFAERHLQRPALARALAREQAAADAVSG